METGATSAVIEERNGVLIGPWRAPRNEAANQRGSIHDDATAQQLGFRGGTVAGSIHLEQFPPLLLRLWGPRWFEQGSISAYFRNATTDQERVRAFAEVPEVRRRDEQVRIWMEDAEGRLVLEGSASVGESGVPTHLEQVRANQRMDGDIRILGHLRPGQELGPVRTSLPLDAGAARMRVITEPLEWYTGPSPWGGPIATPALMVRILRAVERDIERRHPAVGLFGAIELRHLNGPVLLGKEYVASGRLLDVGETPKSEFLWYESTLTDPESGAPVARMYMMTRFMKASSELWRS